MKVYIVGYKGTIYGVFSDRQKAVKYGREQFGSLHFDILEKDVL